MANFLIPIVALTLLVPSFLSSPAFAEDEFASSFVRPVNRKILGMKKQKFSHYRFYWHDIVVGQNRSAFTVIPPVKNSTTGFGLVNMMDNALTVGPDPRSKLLGRCQGFYAATSLEEVSVLMAMNFVFTEGKYNGSTITLMGRNAPPHNKVREVPVIGGSGLFRFASGYALLTTNFLDLTTGNAVVEYNIFVKHY